MRQRTEWEAAVNNENRGILPLSIYLHVDELALGKQLEATLVHLSLMQAERSSASNWLSLFLELSAPEKRRCD